MKLSSIVPESCKIVAVLVVLGLARWRHLLVHDLAAGAGDECAGTGAGDLQRSGSSPGTPKEGTATTFNSDQERLIASKDAFYDISAHYGWTESGQYARYLAGLTEKELGNDKVAEDQLRALSNTRRRELAALAKYALAAVYRDEKRDQDAINLLQTLIEKPTVSVPKANAQFALADIYVSEHQPDKAKVIYDQIAKDNPKNVVGQIAKSHQDELK